MKSQLFDIRREYKKGRLTPGNLNDNPLQAGLTKVKSGRGFHPKVTSSAAVWR